MPRIKNFSVRKKRARTISIFRISQLIIAVTPNDRVKRQLELVFGVYPTKLDYREQKDHILYVANSLLSMKLLNDEDTVLFIAGFRTTTKDASNLIEIHKIEELQNFIKIHD